MNLSTYTMLSRLEHAGIKPSDTLALRRIAMTLTRWFELECGDGNNYASWAIERDGNEPDSPPYMVTHYHDGRTTRSKVPDRETGARKRLAKIMAKYPGLIAYVQTDPRGHSLYIVQKDVLGDRDLELNYSCGIAVYK